MLVISNRPLASRSSDFEITRAITPWIVFHSVQLLLLIGRLILKYWNKMADLLYGLPCVRQWRAQIYRYNDSILSNLQQWKASQLLQIWQSLNWVQYIPHKIGFTKENELLFRSESNQPSADNTTVLCEWPWWLTASCRRYNWSRQVHPFTGSP